MKKIIGMFSLTALIGMTIISTKAVRAEAPINLEAAVQAANKAPSADPSTVEGVLTTSPIVLAAERDETVVRALHLLWRNGLRDLKITRVRLSSSCVIPSCEATSLVVFHLTTPDTRSISASVVASVHVVDVGNRVQVKLVDQSQF